MGARTGTLDSSAGSGWRSLRTVASSASTAWRNSRSLSAPGSSRADYALEIGENLVHGSDGTESAAIEIKLWFAE